MFREIASVTNRDDISRFAAEGSTIVQRAIVDHLDIELVVYTSDFIKSEAKEAARILQALEDKAIAHYRVSDGIMGTLTLTRPLPQVIAAVNLKIPDVREFQASESTVILIAERLQNPDNLGMVLRTADATGVDAVVVTLDSIDPRHKNCVRAARGAVGRINIYSCRSLLEWMESLKERGVKIIGSTGHATAVLYEQPMDPPIAIIVGNEGDGISREVLDACTDLVKIPMSPGQDSLNVGVATGIFLYEVRRKSWGTSLL
jgi:TrmH family RNA methyltransferase